MTATDTAVPQVADVYVQVIIDEACARGIAVEVLDGDRGELRLSHDARVVETRASLSELTTGLAVDRCSDKRATREVLRRHGIAVPRGRTAEGGAGDAALLEEVGEVVVKPAVGECGDGITVGVRTTDELERAVTRAREESRSVVIEERVHGEDLRVVVIDHEMVAAAVRRPAGVVGDGGTTVRELIESADDPHLPPPEEAASETSAAGWELDEVPPADVHVPARGTANVHTGGEIVDVTDSLHPEIAEIAVAVSRALRIPVVGVDLLVADVEDPAGAVVIEANERPGLANHEPQPTVARFVDLLFPATARDAAGRG